MALFSIITTCRNAQDCIERTIRSVLMQDFRDFEYIIMDGKSDDATLEVAGRFCQDFEKSGIPYHIFSESDHGIYEGMNHAVAHASGEYVNFLNADDCLLDDHTLSDVASAILKTPGKDLYYGDAFAVEFSKTYHHIKDLSQIERKMPFSHQAVFASRILLNKYPFRETYRIGADYDFLLTAYCEKCTFQDLYVSVCTVTLDGLSSMDLYHTFLETVEIQRSHGIDHYTDRQFNRKIRTLKIKQFVLDHFPKVLIRLIRKSQRILRKQNY